MIVCGMEMKASEVRLAILNGLKTEYAHVDVKPRKLVLTDDQSAEEVCACRDSLYAFLRENSVELVAIKSRNKVGEFAGGPVGFKFEAIAQLYDKCLIRLIAPSTIAAAKRNNGFVPPSDIPQYQVVAIETAFTALP